MEDQFTRVIAAFSPAHPDILLTAVFSFSLGYVQYYYAIALLLREGRGPMPYWMHAFYLAHDSSWALLCAQAAPRHGHAWLLYGLAAALAVWSGLEVFCMYATATTDPEREHTFGPLFGNKRPRRMGQIVPYSALLLAAMYAVVWLLISYVGEDGMMQSFSYTNVLMTVGPTDLVLRRRSRQGLSMGLALTNLVCAACTFAPFGMYVRALPDIFDTRTFYATGVLMVVHAVYVLSIVAQYPPKARSATGKPPIW